LITHLMVIATGFRLTGALLGAASIAALFDLADTALMLRRLPPPDPGAPLDIGTYGLVGLLNNSARGVGKVLFALLSGPGVWFVVVLAIAAVLSLVFALLLYLTGRGIGHHAIWARIIAILLSLGLAAASCAMMRRELVPIVLLPTALSLYTLWVLIWRFG
jgi:hypothetical protein